MVRYSCVNILRKSHVRILRNTEQFKRQSLRIPDLKKKKTLEIGKYILSQHLI